MKSLSFKQIQDRILWSCPSQTFQKKKFFEGWRDRLVRQGRVDPDTEEFLEDQAKLGEDLQDLYKKLKEYGVTARDDADAIFRLKQEIVQDKNHPLHKLREQAENLYFRFYSDGRTDEAVNYYRALQKEGISDAETEEILQKWFDFNLASKTFDAEEYQDNLQSRQKFRQVKLMEVRAAREYDAYFAS